MRDQLADHECDVVDDVLRDNLAEHGAHTQRRAIEVLDLAASSRIQGRRPRGSRVGADVRNPDSPADTRSSSCTTRPLWATSPRRARRTAHRGILAGGSLVWRTMAFAVVVGHHELAQAVVSILHLSQARCVLALQLRPQLPGVGDENQGWATTTAARISRKVQIYAL